MTRLHVTYDPPPIPGWRAVAYHAHLDGYDEGDPYGHGPTPRAAVRDLAEQRRQRAEHALRRRQDWTLADLRAELRAMRGRA